MKVKDVMTHCLVSVAPSEPILQAIARMISHQVSGMPVIDADGRLVGIVTEGDFLRRAETHTEAPRRRWLELLLGPGSGAEEYVHAHGRTVRDVMSTKVITVGKETPLGEVVRVMEENAIRRVPVIDNGQVVGIVSRADLMFALSEYLSESKRGESISDEGIRRRILSEMRRQTWCPVGSLRVIVKDGMVELNGAIFDERARHALHVLVENVQGVKGIHDHLLWIEPMSGTVIDVPTLNEAAERSGATSSPSSALTSIR